MRTAFLSRKVVVVSLAVAALFAGGWYWRTMQASGYGPGFISSNGRIEATEVDVATRFAGRVVDIAVNEGSFVRAGDVLAQMQVDSLLSQRAEAQALHQQAVNAVETANAQVAARESERTAAQALVAQRESELRLARQSLERTERLVSGGATSRQMLDEHRAAVVGSQAVLQAARAQTAAAQAAVQAAQSQVISARSGVSAAEATIARIQTDIDDSVLKAPRDGRVQYRIAQPGEVLGAGGKVLNLVDLADVYMTFFLPETVAGRVALGADVRIVLDAAPEYVVPAKVSYVASVAQFTPKTVETASERQKLMFRVKAQIDPELLKRHLEHVKTGLPGIAWLKLDPDAAWPQALGVNVP
ncbi:MAG: HlyD family efflux transporter periplasmic adaptor subunit [Pusillimonas sp.]